MWNLCPSTPTRTNIKLSLSLKTQLGQDAQWPTITFSSYHMDNPGNAEVNIMQ